MKTLDRWRWTAVAAGSAALIWTFGLAITGAAWSFVLAGVRLTSRDPFRSLLTGAVLASLGLVGLRLRTLPDRSLAACAAAAAVLACAMGLHYGTFVAGGADAYGYVSQADLWMHGSVLAPAALASEATWNDAPWALTPLGYRPAVAPGWMVPVYPIGLPLAMAVFKTFAGAQGAYFVVPLLGGLLIWWTYLLGRALDGAGAGLFAAVTLLFSPAFLFQLMMPMTDVPVAAWWLGAAVLGWKPEASWRLIASGLLTAAALLTRPNLVVLVLPISVLVMHGARDRNERLVRLASWAIPASLGAVAVAAVNLWLYGAPWRSGYGNLDGLYSLRYTWTNLTQFTQWILLTQTPFILLGLAARGWLARWCIAFAACVLLSYVWYRPFDNWTYLRFLLPAYPMLLAAAAATLLRVRRRYDWPGGSLVAAGLILVCVGLWEGRLAFTVAKGESRYRAAADVARRLPSDAVIITNLHSGSVRYYADRVTLRYEWIGEDEYTAAVETLRAHGHALYALLDGDEVTTFRQRYARVADVSWLDRPPLASVDGRVFLYAVP